MEETPLSRPADHVRALEAACHRLLKNPRDEDSRASLLKALATYKTVPMACFPLAVQHLVATSRDQADVLCLRILETDAASADAINREVKTVCDTLTSLGEALRKGQDRPAPPEEAHT